MNISLVEIWIVLSFFIFFTFKSSSWIITTYVDDYLNGFLVTKPCRDSERPIILFPPKATSKIFLQSWFFIFLCRALQKHLRTWYWKERRYCFWRTHLELSDKRWSSYIIDFLPWRNYDFPFQVMFVSLRSNFQYVVSWWGKKSNTKKNAPSCNGECVKNLRYIFAHDFIYHTYDHARVVILLIYQLIQYCKHFLNDLYIKLLGSLLRYELIITFSESMLLN